MTEKKQSEEIIEETNEATPKERSDSTIKNHVYASMGVGVIPIPIWDVIAVTGVQIDMLRKLAQIYDVPFKEHKVKNILGSLVGGGATIPVATAMSSFVKFIPGVGSLLGAVTMPITAGASTYAIGKVFNQHFATGGTLLTFDTEKVKDYYSEMFEQGKDVANTMNSTKKA